MAGAKTDKIHIFYIAYDGLLPPLGQSQVLQVLVELARDPAYEFTLMSYEKKADLENKARVKSASDRLRAAGVRWIPLRYHRKPSGLATAYDLTLGFLIGAWFCWARGIKIVHCRSYVPGTIGMVLKWFFGVRFIFDMRGFWADERIDVGQWTHQTGFYKIGKWLEERLLKSADVVVSLTAAGVREMKTWKYMREARQVFEVIPTCANLELFQAPQRKGKPRTGPLTIGYVGSTLGWYLFDPVVEAFKAVRAQHPDALMLILNRDEHDFLRDTFLKAGVPPEALELKAVEHLAVPAEMARMDAAFFFIKPVYSKTASAPTKLAELLGCGIPCLTNTGVGDLAEILTAERVGVTVSTFDADTIRKTVPELLRLIEQPDIRDRCATAAQRHFSLLEGAKSYRRIYGSLS